MIEWGFSNMAEMIEYTRNEYREFIWGMVCEARNEAHKKGQINDFMPCSLEVSGTEIKLSVLGNFSPPIDSTRVYRERITSSFGVDPEMFVMEEE